MGTHYIANTIIGVQIENAKTLFYDLLDKEKIEKFGCEESNCRAQRSHKFCCGCGKPTVDVLLPEHINEDDYTIWEWERRVIERGHFHVTTDHNQEGCNMYVGYGIQVEDYTVGDLNQLNDGYAKQQPVLGFHGDIPKLKQELKDFLKQEFGDLWEWDESKFGMWTVLYRGW